MNIKQIALTTALFLFTINNATANQDKTTYLANLPLFRDVCSEIAANPEIGENSPLPYQESCNLLEQLDLKYTPLTFVYQSIKEQETINKGVNEALRVLNTRIPQEKQTLVKEQMAALEKKIRTLIIEIADNEINRRNREIDWFNNVKKENEIRAQ